MDVMEFIAFDRVLFAEFVCFYPIEQLDFLFLNESCIKSFFGNCMHCDLQHGLNGQ